MDLWNKSPDDPFVNIIVGIGFIIYGLLTSLYHPLYLIIYALLIIIHLIY